MAGHPCGISATSLRGLRLRRLRRGIHRRRLGFGTRSLAESLPVVADTVFAIGSCTKAFTTAAIAVRVDDGVLARRSARSCRSSRWPNPHRPRYAKHCACSGAPAVVTGPVPAKVIPKGKFSPEFLALLAYEKFGLGRPVRRLRQFLASYGLLLAESTLVTVLTQISLLLVPVIECIEEQNREAVAWNVHESHWSVFETVEGKRGHRWWTWAFVTADTVFYRLRPSRSTAVNDGC